MDSKQGDRLPDDRRVNMEQERSFGRRVRKLRKERLESDPSFTLRQFAEKIGVSPSYLSMVEKGTTSVRAEHPDWKFAPVCSVARNFASHFETSAEAMQLRIVALGLITLEPNKQLRLF